VGAGRGRHIVRTATPLTWSKRPFTLKPMEDITVHELRERADELLDRVAAGETITITRDGTPVAELRPLAATKPTLTMDEILERFRQLEPDDPQEFRRELDAILDPYA